MLSGPVFVSDLAISYNKPSVHAREDGFVVAHHNEGAALGAR